MRVFNKFFSLFNSFIIVQPDQYVGRLNYINFFRNLFFYIFSANFNGLIKTLLNLIVKIILDIFKFFVFPISLVIYFTKIRFIQLNYFQIGIVSHQLNAMVKNHLLNKKIPVICIPKSHSRSYIKKIFKNLIIIDNIFFNIILLPFINTDFISSKPDNVESFFKNKKLERTSKSFYADIVTTFEKNNAKDPFVFSEKYIKMMIDYKDKYFNNFNLKNTFVLHLRDEKYIKTSYLRSGTIENYFPAIEMLLDSNYQIIRIIHSKSNKLEFSKNYKEINIDDSQNQLFQFYLLSNCKGFLCCHSGPGPLGALLKTPILELNLFPLDFTYALKKGDIFIPKKIKDAKNNYVKYKKIFSSTLKYISSLKQMHKYELEAEENSSDEIMEGVKEFINNLKDTSLVTDSKNYTYFKNNFLKDSEIRFANGQISEYFLKKNHNLFL